VGNRFQRMTECSTEHRQNAMGGRPNREGAERLAREMAVIAEIGRVICSTIEIDEVYEKFAAEARKLIPFDRITMSLCNVPEGMITVAYVSGADLSSYKQGDSLPLKGTLIEGFLQKRTGMLIQSEQMDGIVRRMPQFARHFRAGLRSLIGVPLIYKDAVVGALLFWSKIPDAYTGQDLKLAERIGDQIAGAIANAQLFSDLKKTELSLRASEGRFRAMVEQAAVGATEVDMDTGRFCTVNRRLCEMVGRTERELLATTFHRITHPEDRHLHLEKETLLQAGKIGHYSLEKRYIRKDGKPIWLNLTVSPLWKPGEKPGRNIVVIEDITERKQAEVALQRLHDNLEQRVLDRTEELTRTNGELRMEIAHRRQAEEGLQKSEERFRELVDNIHDVFYELDAKGIIQYASPSVEHLFGYSPEETIGRPISDVLAPEDLAVAIENVKKAMAGPIGPREYRVRTRSGDMRWIRVNSSPVRKEDRVVGIRGVMSDVTERRQAEEALKHTLDQLECRVRERTIELEEINTALRVLINKGDMDRKRLEEDLQSNIGQLVRPFLSKLKTSQSNQERLIYVNILETNLNNILSPFINRLSAAYKNLTPKEIQVAELVKQGKRTKEIAELLGVSVGTVDTHRNNLRKKLELNSKASNLRSHLLSLI
jgi:PAS domain S-box-containing protein